MTTMTKSWSQKPDMSHPAIANLPDEFFSHWLVCQHVTDQAILDNPRNGPWEIVPVSVVGLRGIGKIDPFTITTPWLVLEAPDVDTAHTHAAFMLTIVDPLKREGLKDVTARVREAFKETGCEWQYASAAIRTCAQNWITIYNQPFLGSYHALADMEGNIPEWDTTDLETVVSLMGGIYPEGITAILKESLEAQEVVFQRMFNKVPEIRLLCERQHAGAKYTVSIGDPAGYSFNTKFNAVYVVNKETLTVSETIKSIMRDFRH